MNVAAVQFFATPFALDRNLNVAERLVREAASAGAGIIVLPELFNTGYVYTPRLFTAAENIDGPTIAWLKKLSAELKVLIGGAILLSEAGQFFDTFVLAEPDGSIHIYRKRHLFVWEHCFIEEGHTPGVVETGLGKIGLLVGWDAAFRSAWEALRGKVDLILVSSAPPRLHRAILNFPEAHKVYVADLMPNLLPQREAIDDWFASAIGRGAELASAPVAHAAMAGRFVSEVPFPRLSFGLAALRRPRYLSWIGAATKATMRATFYGSSAVFDSGGEVRGQAAGEEGWVMTNVTSAVTTPRGESMVGSNDFLFADVPGSVRVYGSIFRWLGRLYKNSHRQ